MDGINTIGGIVLDTLVRPLDELPPWGTAHNVESISTHLGGNGAATAYAAATLGVPTRLAGLVGDDSAGDWVIGRLRSSGVNVELVARQDGVSTAQTIAVARSDGERILIQDIGASAVWSIDDVDLSPAATGGSRFFHYGSPFNLTGLRGDAAEVLRRARSAGLETSLDVDWDPRGEWITAFEPLCPYLDYLFLNQLEAEKLTGSQAPAEIFAFFAERGVGTVVLKRGRQGCEIFHDGGRFVAQGFEVEVVDTTGAGDCFCGGFLAGLCRGLLLAEAAQLANAAAAHCIQRAGNSEGVPDYDALRTWCER